MVYVASAKQYLTTQIKSRLLMFW